MVKTLELSSLKHVLPLSWALSYCFWLAVQSLSCVRLFAATWTAARLAPLSFAVSQSLLKFIFINSVILSKTISSAAPFCLQSFWASGSFPLSRLFASCGQSVRTSLSATVLPMNIQGWFPLELTGWISLYSRRLSKVFSSTTIWKHQFFGAQPSLWFNSHIHIHDYWKNNRFDYMNLGWKTDVSAF